MSSLLSFSGNIVLAVALGAAVAGQARAADEAAPPVKLGAAATLDTLAVVGGQQRHGALTFGNVDLTAAWQGGNGWEAFGYVLADGHGGFSERYAGDTQVVSNIDAPAGVRLFEAWVRHTSVDERVVVTAGAINLNGLFDTQPAGSVFLNSSAGIGGEYAQSGPSVFPFSGLGAVVEWRQGEHWRWRAGAFDGVPGDPDHSEAFASFRMSGKEGLNVVVEAERAFHDGFVKVGHWSYTAKYDRIDGAGSHARSGTYAQLSKTVVEPDDDSGRSVATWVRVGVADARTLPVASCISGGVSAAGLLPGRKDDQAGIAVFQARFGHDFREANPGTGKAETTVELTYQFAFKGGLVVQPDVQFVQNPSGQAGHALVAGFRVRLSSGS